MTSAAENEGKICTSCGETKPIDAFHRFGAKLERIGKWCEVCFQRHNGGRKRQPAKSGKTV